MPTRTIFDDVVRLRKDHVIEGVKEFSSKFQIDPLGQIKQLSRVQIRRFLARSLQNVLARISETTVGAGGGVGGRKVVRIEPHIDIGMRDSASPGLIGALQPGRARILKVSC